jgi:hypothetical protein
MRNEKKRYDDEEYKIKKDEENMIKKNKGTREIFARSFMPLTQLPFALVNNFNLARLQCFFGNGCGRFSSIRSSHLPILSFNFNHLLSDIRYSCSKILDVREGKIKMTGERDWT